MGTKHRGTADEVRALDAYVKLMRCANAVRARAEGALREIGLTENQFGVLEALFHLGPLHQHALGRKLLTSRANVTLIVDQLAARSLVRRCPDSEDRRRIAVHLTAKGRRYIGALFPAHAQHIAGTLAALSVAEQRQLGALCRKLGRSLAPVDGVGTALGA